MYVYRPGFVWHGPRDGHILERLSLQAEEGQNLDPGLGRQDGREDSRGSPNRRHRQTLHTPRETRIPMGQRHSQVTK